MEIRDELTYMVGSGSVKVLPAGLPVAKLSWVHLPAPVGFISSYLVVLLVERVSKSVDGGPTTY